MDFIGLCEIMRMYFDDHSRTVLKSPLHLEKGYSIVSYRMDVSLGKSPIKLAKKMIKQLYSYSSMLEKK